MKSMKVLRKKTNVEECDMEKMSVCSRVYLHF